MSKVNLDALIPREDFGVEIINNASHSLGDKLKVSELIRGQGFFYSSLRKPDFQRETSDWDPEKIASFIKSFIDGDLIPSIILWQAGQYIFVIDGAHRLSALISWVNDDYGDGFISQAFFNHTIDSEQKKIADLTRKRVNDTVGSYRKLMDAIQNPEKANALDLRVAGKLGFIALQLQWVAGDSNKAESSFFTINQKATPISETELELLKARNKPHAMTARAIVRSGLGHNYWKIFAEDIQQQIQIMAKEINEALFLPEMKTPIKTLDLPLAGKGYSSNSLGLIFDLVKISNDFVLPKRKYGVQEVPDDKDGQNTLRFMRNTYKIIKRMTTNHPSSLGLHPAVYFYSEKGRYQPTAFLAWADIFREYERNTDNFISFIRVRAVFEQFLVENKHLTNQISGKYGSGLKGYKQLRSFYIDVLGMIADGVLDSDLREGLKIKYSYLNFEYHGEFSLSSNFNSETKSEVFLVASLKTAQRCSICGGYVHMNSLSIDHIVRKQDGGLGRLDNGAITHVFCNSTVKN